MPILPSIPVVLGLLPLCFLSLDSFFRDLLRTFSFMSEVLSDFLMLTLLSLDSSLGNILSFLLPLLPYIFWTLEVSLEPSLRFLYPFPVLELVELFLWMEEMLLKGFVEVLYALLVLLNLLEVFSRVICSVSKVCRPKFRSEWPLKWNFQETCLKYKIFTLRVWHRVLVLAHQAYSTHFAIEATRSTSWSM